MSTRDADMPEGRTQRIERVPAAADPVNDQTQLLEPVAEPILAAQPPETNTENLHDDGASHQRAQSEDATGALGGSNELAAAARRGSLKIRDSVVEKITAQILVDNSDAAGAAKGLTGLLSRSGAQRPTVEAETSGKTATVAVRLSLPYPAGLKTATEDVRELIRRRVHHLTGVTVRHVDIKVDALRLGESS